jgi:transposase
MADPLTIALATAVVTGMASKISEHASESVGEGLKRLRRAVFKRFRGDEAAQDALDEAMLDADDPAAVEKVAEHLERAAALDPEIGALVRELGSQVEIDQEGDGNVVNQIHGDVSDRARVVQGRDFHGDIHL